VIDLREAKHPIVEVLPEGGFAYIELNLDSNRSVRRHLSDQAGTRGSDRDLKIDGHKGMLEPETMVIGKVVLVHDRVEH
jgi:hypothetical protein